MGIRMGSKGLQWSTEGIGCTIFAQRVVSKMFLGKKLSSGPFGSAPEIFSQFPSPTGEKAVFSAHMDFLASSEVSNKRYIYY